MGGFLSCVPVDTVLYGSLFKIIMKHHKGNEVGIWSLTVNQGLQLTLWIKMWFTILYGVSFQNWLWPESSSTWVIVWTVPLTSWGLLTCLKIMHIFKCLFGLVPYKAGVGKIQPASQIWPAKGLYTACGRSLSPAWPRLRGQPEPWCIWPVPPPPGLQQNGGGTAARLSFLAAS